MRLSERRGLLLKALHAIVKTDIFTVAELCQRIAGLATKEPGNLQLLTTLHGCLGRELNPKRVGLLLKAVTGQRYGDLTLLTETDDRHGGRWRYHIFDDDHAAPKPAIKTWVEMETAALVKEDQEFERKLEGKTLAQQVKIVGKELDKVESRKEEFARQEQLERGRAALAELEAQAEKERTFPELTDDATVLYPRRFFGRQEAEDIQSIVNRPQDGVECQRCGKDHNWQLRVLLRGTWAERKYAHEQLIALFRRKSWASEHERVFDGATPELLHGKVIPAWASRDPTHYNTASGSEQLVTRLLLAGDTTTTLGEASMRQRLFASWGTGLLGNSPHRAPGMHVDVRAAVRMKKFDPLAGQISRLTDGGEND